MTPFLETPMKSLLLCLVLMLWIQEAPAVGRLADLQVIDRTTGATLPVWRHQGRHYIAGQPGHEYQLSIASQRGSRLLAVGSVDGVNIISGESAGYSQDGYVLNAHEQLSVAGWRTSLHHTATFYFTELGDSYAARTGRPNDVGVIGLALFREKSACCWPWRSEDRFEQKRRQAAPAPEAAAPPAVADAQRKDESLGTGYGRSENSEAYYTAFERASATPDEIITLYYDSYENLQRQGVIPAKARRWERPQPFPNRFVPPPS